MWYGSSQYIADQNQCADETAFDTRVCVCDIRVCVDVCVCGWVGACVRGRERERFGGNMM